MPCSALAPSHSARRGSRLPGKRTSADFSPVYFYSKLSIRFPRRPNIPPSQAFNPNHESISRFRLLRRSVNGATIYGTVHSRGTLASLTSLDPGGRRYREKSEVKGGRDDR